MEYHLRGLSQILRDNGSFFFPPIPLVGPWDDVGEQDDVCHRPISYGSFCHITQGLGQTARKVRGCVIVMNTVNGLAHFIAGGHSLVQQFKPVTEPGNGYLHRLCFLREQGVSKGKNPLLIIRHGCGKIHEE